MNELKRLLRLISGLALCGAGIYCTIQANIGLAPWDALTIGIAQVSGVIYGNVSVSIAVVVIILDLLLREKVGVGTLLNAVIIPKIVDLLNLLDPLPMQQSFWAGLFWMLVGQVLISVGTCVYMREGMGCGPRDTLMVALKRHFPNMPVGLARGAVEAAVLTAGWLLGAKVGFGSLLSMFGISFIIQTVFRLLRFDMKAVRHENCVETFARWGAAQAKG